MNSPVVENGWAMLINRGFRKLTAFVESLFHTEIWTGTLNRPEGRGKGGTDLFDFRNACHFL